MRRPMSAVNLSDLCEKDNCFIDIEMTHVFLQGNSLLLLRQKAEKGLYPGPMPWSSQQSLQGTVPWPDAPTPLQGYPAHKKLPPP
jgi:hypothetical protein